MVLSGLCTLQVFTRGHECPPYVAEFAARAPLLQPVTDAMTGFEISRRGRRSYKNSEHRVINRDQRSLLQTIDKPCRRASRTVFVHPQNLGGLEVDSELDVEVQRFYLWNEPAFVFGEFNDAEGLQFF